MSQNVSDLDPRVIELTENFSLDSPLLRDQQITLAAYRRLRATEPVKKLANRGRPQPEWLLTKYDDVRRVFQDDESFTSLYMVGGGLPGPVPTDDIPFDDVDPYEVAVHAQKLPMSLDPPHHSQYRSLLNPMFSPKAAKRTESISREVVASQVSTLRGRTETEIHHDLTKPVPARIICRILGLPEEDWERHAITTPDSGGVDNAAFKPNEREAVMRRTVPSLDAQMTMLDLAFQRRKEPKDDLITAVAHLTTDGGRLLTAYELGSVLAILLSGGVHTTTLGLDAAILHLGRNPDLQSELRENPERLRPFIEEVLRMWPPLSLFWRWPKADVVIGDKTIAAGDTIHLCLASANRDEDEFPNSEVFDMDRHPNRHMAFAIGIHRCLGSTLARQELTVTLEEILRELPRFTVDEGRTCVPPQLEQLHDPDRRLTLLFDA